MVGTVYTSILLIFCPYVTFVKTSCDWSHVPAFVIDFAIVVLWKNRKHIYTLVGRYRSPQAGLQNVALWEKVCNVFWRV